MPKMFIVPAVARKPPAFASGPRPDALAAPLEILHCPFVLLSGSAGLERAEIAPPPSLAIDLARIETVLAAFEFADHTQLTSASAEGFLRRLRFRKKIPTFREDIRNYASGRPETSCDPSRWAARTGWRLTNAGTISRHRSARAHQARDVVDAPK
jgi:hypothetical protein